MEEEECKGLEKLMTHHKKSAETIFGINITDEQFEQYLINAGQPVKQLYCRYNCEEDTCLNYGGHIQI